MLVWPKYVPRAVAGVLANTTSVVVTPLGLMDTIGPVRTLQITSDPLNAVTVVSSSVAVPVS